jgi:hypothetical protein
MSRYPFEAWVVQPDHYWHEATCRECGWDMADDTTPQVMVQAKQHVRQTGHTVSKSTVRTWAIEPFSPEPV